MRSRVFLRRVVNRLTGFQHARINPDIRQMPDVGIGHDLERQRRERLVIRRAPQFRLGSVRRHALHRRHVHWRRQIVDYRIKQRLHALVLERRARNHRHQLQRDRRTPQRRAQFRRLQLVLVEILGEDGVVVLRDVFDHLLAVRLVELRAQRRRLYGRFQRRARRQVRRIPQFLEREDFVFRAKRFVFPDDRALLDEIDHSDEIVFASDGVGDGNGMRGESLPHRQNRVLEIGADAVHLVDERDARHAVLVRLPPDRFRLWLHARDRVEHRNRSVQHAQRPLDFHREIHVARRIDDVDAEHLVEPLPRSRRRRRRDRNPALALLIHPVHHGRAFVHLADLVGHARIEKDALGDGRLARIDMRHDPDVAGLIELYLPWHFLIS